MDSLFIVEADLLDIKNLTLEDQGINLKKVDSISAKIKAIMKSEKKVEPVKFIVKYQMTVNHQAIRISTVMNPKLQILQVDTITAL